MPPKTILNKHYKLSNQKEGRYRISPGPIVQLIDLVFLNKGNVSKSGFLMSTGLITMEVLSISLLRENWRVCNEKSNSASRM
jgi:hypothetical protein